MQDIRMIGTVGDDDMKPRVDYDKEKGPYVRFSMLVEDEAGRLVEGKDGKKHKPWSKWRVILWGDDRGLNLIKLIYPGRKLYVEGRMTSDPNAVTKENGDKVVYPNLICRAAKVKLLDSTPGYDAKRLCNNLVEAGIVEEDTAEEMRVKLVSHFAAMTEKNPPIIYNDRDKSDDPDKLDSSK